LLVRHWLTTRGKSALPLDLAFGWGAAQTESVLRNPSSGRIQFPSLYRPSTRALHQDAAWAGFARKATQLLQFVAAKHPGLTVMDIERALFMVGYHVQTEESLPSNLPPLREP